MSQRETLIFLFWLTGLAASVDAFFLFRRRINHEVPWFAVYLVVVIIKQAVYCCLYLYARPFYLYYISKAFEAAVLVLSSMFIIEAVRNLLVDYPTIRRWGRSALIGVAISLLLLSILILPYGSENSELSMKIIHLPMRSARMIQLGVIVALFGLASYLGLGWRHYQFGLLLGFGLYVAVSLSCEAYVTQMGRSVGWKIMLVDCYAYICTLILWLIYVLRADLKCPPNLPPSASKDLDGWGEALNGL